MTRCAALIVAAGRGTRLESAGRGTPLESVGGSTRLDAGTAPKQYRLLDGRPVLAHSMSTFAAADGVDCVRVVIHACPADRAVFLDGRPARPSGGVGLPPDRSARLEVCFEDDGAGHTLERFETAFYAPLLSDWRNFGEWSNDGSQTAAQRANSFWKQTLAAHEAPAMSTDRREALEAFVERRTREGGSNPLD